jgi:hypothetical protein
LTWPWILASKWVDWTISVRWPSILIFDFFWDCFPLPHIIKGWKFLSIYLIGDCSHVESSCTSTLGDVAGILWIVLTAVPWLVPSIHGDISLWGKAVIYVLLSGRSNSFFSTFAKEMLEFWIFANVI